MTFNSTAHHADKWQLATVQYSLSRQQLVRHNKTVNLEPRQHRLLQTLLANIEQPVTRETLIARVWDNRIVSDGAINRAVSMLRKAFAELDAETDFIITRPKLGYQLNVHAQPLSDDVVIHNSSISADKPSRFLVFALLIIVLAGIAFVWWWRTEHDALQLGVMQPHSSFDGLESQVSTIKQGKVLLYRRVTAQGNGQIWLNDLTDNNNRPLTSPEHNSQYPKLSPDGETVAYVQLSAQACSIMLLKLAETDASPTPVHHCPTDNIPKLSWHADNNTLFFRQRGDKTQPYQLYQLNITNGVVQQLTLLAPNYDGLGDVAFAAAKTGNQVAILRYQGANSTTILLLDASSGDLKQVKQLDIKANDIAWLNKSTLIFSSDQTLYQLDIHSGESTAIVHAADYINSFALTDDALYFSATEVSTNIWLKVSAAEPVRLINSSRIDSLPRIAPDGKQLAFLSTRQGRYQLWLKQQQQETLLAELPGTPAFVRLDWDTLSNNLLMVKDGNVYQINVKNRRLSSLFNELHPVKVANWGPDGSSIIFSSQRSGDWQLWQLDLNSAKLQQLTSDGGYAGRIWQGKLYFTKFHQDGLWVKDLMQETEQLLLSDVDKINWLNGQIDQGKYYYYQPNQGVFSFDLANREQKLVMAEPEHFVRHFSVLNQQLYYVQQQPLQGDIYRVPILMR